MIEDLYYFGLSRNDFKIYSYLLKSGSSSVSEISKSTGIHRRNVYDSCERLLKKGILSYVILNRKKYFKAISVKKLRDIYLSKFNEVLNNLDFGISSKKEGVDVSVFKGTNGLRVIFEDQIETKKEIFVLGASSKAFEIFPFYMNWYDKRRKDKKILARIISADKVKPIALADIRYLPQKYSNPLAVNIYGDKVALIIWNTQNPFAILINNKQVSDSYKKYFEAIWKISRPA